MNESEVSEQGVSVSTGFSEQTLLLNQTVCKFRLLIGKLDTNCALIDTVYQKVLLGGLAKQNSSLVSEAAMELQTLLGLCWSSINAECEEGQKLTFDEWAKIGSEPPAWLRGVFEQALILSGMPDVESMERVGKGEHVLVIRALDMRGEALLPQVGALMPKGFGVNATQLWWPWVMGGQTPVVLVPTDQENVLQEFSAKSLLASTEESDKAL